MDEGKRDSIIESIMLSNEGLNPDEVERIANILIEQAEQYNLDITPKIACSEDLDEVLYPF